MSKKAGILAVAGMAAFTQAASAGMLKGHEDIGIMTLGLSEKPGKQRDSRLVFSELPSLNPKPSNAVKKQEQPICRITGRPFTP